MPKTIVIVGYGPGVSTSVAEKFGAEGFSVALVARNQARLDSGASALKAKGITAAAFIADASDPAAIIGAIRAARGMLGPITAILWNAFSGAESADLMDIDPARLSGVFDVAVVGLLAAVQEALPDLKAAGDGAVLVTNGAFGEQTPEMDAIAIMLKAVGVPLANAAKRKLVGMLSARLASEGVYVGEVTIAGAVKGTPTEIANSIEGATIADKFWALYKGRSELRARVS